MPTHLKTKLYRTVVHPLALYGAECWPATNRHEQALHVKEMQMIRWTLGLTRWDEVKNEDVRKTTGVAPIMETMREAWLRGYGHVVRSEEESIEKRALRLNNEGKRPRGRPKKRWMDRIKEDTRHDNGTPDDVLDRKKWRAICWKVDPALRWDKR